MNWNTTIFTPANSTEVVYNLSSTKWIAFEVFSVILITLSCYVFIVLIRFNCLKWKKRKRISKTPSTRADHEITNNSNGNVRQSGISFYNSTKKRRVGKTGKSASSLRILCLCASFFAVIRISADQLELGTYGRERIHCRIYQVIVVVTYAVSATFIYSALWMRLRIFFIHPIIRHLASSSIMCLIWFALFCILSSALLNTVIFIATVQMKDSDEGCNLGETMSIAPNIRYVILTISTVVSQGILLSLFLYPLLKHRSKIKLQAARHNPSFVTFTPTQAAQKRNSRDANAMDSFSTNKSRISVQQSKKLRREKRLVAIICRVLITAVVCVISDVIAAVITIAFNDQPRVVSNLTFNLNLLINLVSVLLSFGDWKQRLVPCCHNATNAKSKNAVSTLITKTHQNGFLGSLASAQANGKVYVSDNLSRNDDTSYSKDDSSA